MRLGPGRTRAVASRLRAIALRLNANITRDEAGQELRGMRVLVLDESLGLLVDGSVVSSPELRPRTAAVVICTRTRTRREPAYRLLTVFATLDILLEWGNASVLRLARVVEVAKAL